MTESEERIFFLVYALVNLFLEAGLFIIFYRDAYNSLRSRKNSMNQALKVELVVCAISLASIAFWGGRLIPVFDDYSCFLFHGFIMILIEIRVATPHILHHRHRSFQDHYEIVILTVFVMHHKRIKELLKRDTSSAGEDNRVQFAVRVLAVLLVLGAVDLCVLGHQHVARSHAPSRDRVQLSFHRDPVLRRSSAVDDANEKPVFEAELGSPREAQLIARRTGFGECHWWDEHLDMYCCENWARRDRVQTAPHVVPRVMHSGVHRRMLKNSTEMMDAPTSS
ncbi:hypothetical protein BJ742DRAFT_737458 [Cladochytrium replicatum]|nr:hypothetical protein BJ742DRAFT_737458 [Cladochytrium replicatum]